MNRGATKPTGFLMLTAFLAMVLGFSLAALALQGGPFQASASMLDNASSQDASPQVEGNSLDDLEIVLTPPIAINEVGTHHTVTATVTGTGNQRTPNIEVLFKVVIGASEGATGSGVTNPDGNVDFTFTSQVAGFDVIQACITDGSDNFACDLAFKVWTRPEPQFDIILEPERARNPLGTEHTVTATATEGTDPVTGAQVNFEVASGPTAGVTGSAVTDLNGQADFTYEGAGTGRDIIHACVEDPQGVEACARAAKTWTDREPEFGISLEPERSTNPVGNEHTLTATVTEGTDPVTGAQVNFEVASGPTAGVTGSAVTDLNGQAGFTYEGAGTGRDIIHACVEDPQGVEACARAAKTWTDREDPPRDSCRGENSCQGRNISVGENSCNAEDACNGNNIVIGSDSCNGEGSCRGNRTTIGSGSCNEEESCNGNNGRIGNGSCNDEEACVGHNNSVGDNTCNEEGACSGRGNRGNSNSQGQGQGPGNSGRGGRP